MKTRLIILITFIFINTAHAGFLIEPYLGFSFNGKGKMTANIPASSKFTSEYSSLTYGGRVGYSMMNIMAGLDYSMQRPELETKNATTTYKDKIKKKQLGIFAGYQFPIMLRAWVTYFISADFKGTQTGDHHFENIDKFEDGSGFAIGVGYTGLPFVAFNLEYRAIKYDKWVSDGEEVTSTEKMNLNEILLSVSLPFDL